MYQMSLFVKRCVLSRVLDPLAKSPNQRHYPRVKHSEKSCSAPPACLHHLPHQSSAALQWWTDCRRLRPPAVD